MSIPSHPSGPRPVGEISDDREFRRPGDDARQADAEVALYKLEQFLASWSPSKPPGRVPVRSSPPRVPPGDSPQKTPLLNRPRGKRPRSSYRPFGGLSNCRRPEQPRGGSNPAGGELLKGVLLVLASVGIFFALDDAGLLKWLPSIVPSAHRTAIQSPADNPDASAFYLLLKNDAELRGPDVATPPGSSGDIRPAVPEASTSPGGEARDVAAPS